MLHDSRIVVPPRVRPFSAASDLGALAHMWGLLQAWLCHATADNYYESLLWLIVHVCWFRVKNPVYLVQVVHVQ